MTFALTDKGDRHSLVEGGDGSPLSSALLSCGVTDLLHQRCPISVLQDSIQPFNITSYLSPRLCT